jgi:hypothetical protein
MKSREKVKFFQTDWGWEPYYSLLKKESPSMLRYIPVIPRSQIAEYYRGVDLVVGQMQLGYLGLAELEAAACGVPVTVYSRDPNTPFLPKRPDPAELARTIDRLLQDPDYREEYVMECMQYVKQHHDASMLAGEFDRIVQHSHRQEGGRLGLRDLAQLELGTGLELFEDILGGPSKLLRSRLLNV